MTDNIIKNNQLSYSREAIFTFFENIVFKKIEILDCLRLLFKFLTANYKI